MVPKYTKNYKKTYQKKTPSVNKKKKFEHEILREEKKRKKTKKHTFWQ